MGSHSQMLCVDDDAQLRKSLEQQFTDEDFEVDTAASGDAAIEMLRKKVYDIVLLDLRMKPVDGITVLKEMRKNSNFPKVIMLTGVDDVTTAMECVKLGAVDYISKPYDPEELLHVVIKVLGTQ